VHSVCVFAGEQWRYTMDPSGSVQLRMVESEQQWWRGLDAAPLPLPDEQETWWPVLIDSKVNGSWLSSQL
jgi:hypothetical protein